MRKVSDILARKGSSVFAIDADTLVLDALRLMADKNIGSVVVTKNGEYAGILRGPVIRPYHRWRNYGYFTAGFIAGQYDRPLHAYYDREQIALPAGF
jgi:hypothetical protein